MTATLQRPPAKRKKGFDPDFRFTGAQYQKMISEGIISAIRSAPKVGSVLQITAPISPGRAAAQFSIKKAELSVLRHLSWLRGRT